jgi:hypothetical protein
MLSLHRPDSNFPARSSLPHHAPASVRCVRAHQEVIGRPPSGGCVAIPGSYDHRCDVYSFGVLLWEVMHEAIPFGHLDSVEAATTAHSGARPPMSLDGQRAQFAPIIAACWSQAPDQRPALTEVARTLIQLEILGAGCDMQTAQQVFNGEALGGM